MSIQFDICRIELDEVSLLRQNDLLAIEISLLVVGSFAAHPSKTSELIIDLMT